MKYILFHQAVFELCLKNSSIYLLFWNNIKKTFNEKEREREKIIGGRNGCPLRRSFKISIIERIRNEKIKEMIKIKGTILDDIF